MSWPVKVNGHKVVTRTPQRVIRWAGRLETDHSTEFVCQNCGHSMNPPKNRIEDEEWVKNAFQCVECTHADTGTEADSNVKSSQEKKDKQHD